MSSISINEKISKMKANKKLTVKIMKEMVKEKADIFRGYSTMKRDELIKVIANNRNFFLTFHKSLEKGTIKQQMEKKATPKKAAPAKKPAAKKAPSKNKEIKKLEKELKLAQQELKEVEDSEDESILKANIKEIKEDLKDLKKSSKN